MILQLVNKVFNLQVLSEPNSQNLRLEIEFSDVPHESVIPKHHFGRGIDRVLPCADECYNVRSVKHLHDPNSTFDLYIQVIQKLFQL